MVFCIQLFDMIIRSRNSLSRVLFVIYVVLSANDIWRTRNDAHQYHMEVIIPVLRLSEQLYRKLIWLVTSHASFTFITHLHVLM